MIIGSRLCITLPYRYFACDQGSRFRNFYREATLDIVLIVRRGPDQIEKPNDCSCEMLRRCIPSESAMSDKKQRCDFRALERCLAIPDEVRFRPESEGVCAIPFRERKLTSAVGDFRD